MNILTRLAPRFSMAPARLRRLAIDFRFGAKPLLSPNASGWPRCRRIATAHEKFRKVAAPAMNGRDQHHHELWRSTPMRAAIQNVHHRHGSGIAFTGRSMCR
jgi:hypothetical protein